MKLKKSRGANLERLRIFFFLMGLCISGALVLTAFEWRTSKKEISTLGELSDNELPPETTVAVVSKNEKREIHKQEVVIDVLKLVEELEKSDEGKSDEPKLELSGEPEPISIGFLPEKRDEEELPVPESTVPQFPGGMTALSDFLKNNLEYPARAKSNGVKGTVWVAFLVDKNGNVNNIQVLRGIGMGCDEEAMRVVGLMPKWIPGKQRGRPVDVLYRLPVKFTIW